MRLSDNLIISKVYPSHGNFGQDDHDYRSHSADHQSAKMSDYGTDVFPSMLPDSSSAFFLTVILLPHT